MQDIVLSITRDHDPGYVLLAVVICALGSVTTMLLAGRAQSHHRAVWVILSGVCLGAGMWATHLIAMVGYRSDVPMAYTPVLLSMALVFGTLLTQLGLAVITRAPHVALVRMAGGALVGLGAIALHSLLMGALITPGQVEQQPALITLAVLLALTGGVFAGYFGFARNRAVDRVAGALSLMVMVIGLHFVATGGLTIDPTTPLPVHGTGVARNALTLPVVFAVFAILATGATSALFDARMARRTAEAAERFRVLTNSTFEGILILRDGRIVDHNAAAGTLIGVPSEQILDTPFLDWITDDDRDRQSVANALTDPDQPCQTRIDRPDGTSLDVEIAGRQMALHDGRPGQVVAVRDITARRKSEERIRFLATHDALTDLPNRRLFMELADKVLAQARRSGAHFAVMVLDLDGFKIINDTHGHDAGDSLIQAMARRISTAVRDSDVVARLGGDEFVILQTATTQPTNALSLSRRLMDEVARPVRLADAEVSVGVSIGIALYPGDGERVDELVRNADTAMYRAKADGKGAYRFFEPAMDAELEARRRLEGRMRAALSDGLFTVHYQPLVACETGRLLGFEALLRWNDPELGPVPPGDFIPVAEEIGLIVPLGDLVLQTACRDATSWPGHLRVAVNLSPVQFRRPGLVAAVERALEESGLPGSRLELEITESLLIQDKDNVLRVLDALKARGIRIAMDDFGTGYSSLSYLQSFPFDKLKIDRVFVRNIQSNDGDAAIVRAVAAMGRSLNMDVVAEGVETGPQAEILRKLHCDALQGFLIARPLAPPDALAFIETWPKRSANGTLPPFEPPPGGRPAAPH